MYPYWDDSTDQYRERYRAGFTLRPRSLPLAVLIQSAFPYMQLQSALSRNSAEESRNSMNISEEIF